MKQTKGEREKENHKMYDETKLTKEEPNGLLNREAQEMKRSHVSHTPTIPVAECVLLQQHSPSKHMEAKF